MNENERRASLPAVQEFHAAIGDTYMNVIRFGRGKRTLVMLPGISLTPLEDSGAGVAAAYAALAQDYTVYLPDRRAVLAPHWRTEEMAEDVFTVLTQLGVTEADVYGVSHGGMMAMYLAAQHPDFVRKLVLCSTQCHATEKMLAFARRGIELIRERDVRGLNRHIFAHVYSEAYRAEYQEAFDALEGVGTREDCARYEVQLRACVEFDLTDRMGQIRCPTFVLGDENDRATGIEGCCEIVRYLSCESYFYDRYSHAVYDEAPDIKERIAAFLKRE